MRRVSAEVGLLLVRRSSRVIGFCWSTPCLEVLWSTTPFGELAESLAPFGLSLDAGKSHAIAYTPGLPPPAVITTPIGDVAVSENVTYIGSIVSSNGTAKADAMARADRAGKQLGALRRSWLASRSVSRRTRAIAVRSCVLSTLTFGLEGAAVKATDTKRLSVVWNRAVRFAYSIGKRGQAATHTTDVMLREWLDLPCAADNLRQQRLRWAGHLTRHESSVTRLAFNMKGTHAQPTGQNSTGGTSYAGT